jgi:hypothetical protein
MNKKVIIGLLTAALLSIAPFYRVTCFKARRRI